MAFSPDGPLLTIVSGSVARLWDPTSRTPIGDPLTTSSAEMEIWAVTFSPDRA